jgi:hypothetical protein
MKSSGALRIEKLSPGSPLDYVKPRTTTAIFPYEAHIDTTLPLDFFFF